MRVMIFAIHRTVEWWTCIGRHLGTGEACVVTDLAGEGDWCVKKDFYAELRRLLAYPAPPSGLLTADEVDDVVARCRSLRWQRPALARAMAQAMAFAMERALEAFRPDIVLSFPIDRYVKDVLERRARARGIPHLELTASPLPGMAMLLRRGRLVRTEGTADPSVLESKRQELSNPAFVPTYVRGRSQYNHAKYLRTYFYFRLRALAFKAISVLQRDPLNLHYLDAQPNLGHKNRLADARIIAACDHDWRGKIDRFEPARRVLFGLQLFPEASIDYWISNRQLIDHDEVLVDAAAAYSEAGYLVLVKDHPLQFGFRQMRLIDRLKALPNVVLVPYEVSGNELLSLVGTNFTCTGTLGLQAALQGITSVVTDSYYSNDADFVIFRSREQVRELPRLSERHGMQDSLEARQRRIVRQLMSASFEGDFFSFSGFNRHHPSEGAKSLAVSVGQRLDVYLNAAADGSAPIARAATEPMSSIATHSS